MSASSSSNSGGRSAPEEETSGPTRVTNGDHYASGSTSRSSTRNDASSRPQSPEAGTPPGMWWSSSVLSSLTQAVNDIRRASAQSNSDAPLPHTLVIALNLPFPSIYPHLDRQIPISVLDNNHTEMNASHIPLNNESINELLTTYQRDREPPIERILLELNVYDLSDAGRQEVKDHLAQALGHLTPLLPHFEFLLSVPPELLRIADPDLDGADAPRLLSLMAGILGENAGRHHQMTGHIKIDVHNSWGYGSDAPLLWFGRALPK